MLVTRSLKSLSNYVAKETPEKCQSKLREIQSNLKVSYFNPSDSSFKPGMLTLVLRQILPITYHQNVQLRLQAETFLFRLSSLVSAFAPTSLFSSYAELEKEATSSLQPAASALVFTFWARSLRACNPVKRAQQLETCYNLLLSSQIDMLKRVVPEVWMLLKDCLDIDALKNVVRKLIESSLTGAVATLCERDPKELFGIVAKEAPLQFLKEIIPGWARDHDVCFEVLSERIVEFLGGSNSSDISSALEVVCLVINSLKKPADASDGDVWTRVLAAVEGVWPRATESQKAKIIELCGLAHQAEIVKLERLRKFLVFDENLPSGILVAIIRIGAIFVAEERKIPHGFLDCLTKISIERDPLLYLACLNCLHDCFHEMHEIAPVRTERLLDLCLNPLPRYFVEQLAIINMFLAFDWGKFPLSKLKTNMVDIVVGFIREPQPSVVAELPKLIQATGIVVPYLQLDWFELAPSYLSFLPSCDPVFIMELLDGGFLAPAFYSNALRAVSEVVVKSDDRVLGRELFSRGMSVLEVAINTLQIKAEGTSTFKMYRTTKWKHYCKAIPKLLETVDDDLSVTNFGQMIEASLFLINASMMSAECTIESVLCLASIAVIFGCAFTHICCKIIKRLPRKDPKSEAMILKFFDLQFPFDYSIDVALAAIDSLKPMEIVWNENLQPYMKAAAAKSRDVLAKYRHKDDDYFGAFLVFCHDEAKAEYVKKSAAAIPFAEWVIEDSDEDFISTLKDIEVDDYEALDSKHKEVVNKYPSVFLVKNHHTEKHEAIFEYAFDKLALDGHVSEGEDVDTPVEKEEVKVVDVPLSPYPCTEPSKASLLGYLWYSTRNVLTSDDWTKVEDYALSIDDYKFAVAFLGFGLRHKLTVRTSTWAKKVCLDRNNADTYVCVSLLLHFVHKKWEDLDENELELVNSSMTEMGLQNTSPSHLVELYSTEIGFRRMVIESIMMIDPERFHDFPLVAHALCSKQHFFEHFDEILDLLSQEDAHNYVCEAASMFSANFLPRLPNSLFEQTTVPPGIPDFEKYLPSSIEPVPFQQTEVDEEHLGKLISFFEKSRSCDEFMFQLIFHMKITQEQYQRMLVPMRDNAKSQSPHIHVEIADLAAFNKSSNITTGSIDTHRPPSVTRQLMDLVLSPHCPDAGLVDPTPILQKMKPVFYNLLSRGFEIMRAKVFDEKYPIVEESVIAMQPVSQQALGRAKSVFQVSPVVSCQVIELLHETSETLLCQYFGTSTADGVFVEIAKIISKVLAENRKYLYGSISVTRTILACTPLPQLIDVFTEPEFLNAPEFPNVFVMFLMLKKSITASGDEALIEKWNTVEQSLSDKVESAERLNLLKSEKISEALPKIYDTK